MITIILLDLWETLATKKALIFDTLKQESSLSDGTFPFFVEQLLKLEVSQINEDEFWQNMRRETGVDSIGRQVRLIDIYRKITIINEELVDLALDFQSHGGKIALFSNTDPAARDYLREIGLLDRFDQSFFSFDAKLLKPDVKFIEHVINTMDVPAQTVAYFDDNPSCIQAANDIGVHGFVYKELADVLPQLQQFTSSIPKSARV